MSLHALVSGSLWENPERRQSKNGKNFVLASLKTEVGAETRTVKVLAFSETVQEQLMEMHHGDALSVTGGFKAEIWEPENRGARISMTVFAESVMALKPKPKAPKDVPGARPERAPPWNDEVPF
jgi:single-stranded DNA-binding protein